MPINQSLANATARSLGMLRRRSTTVAKFGDAVAFAHQNSPNLTVYPWSSGFGTKFANPATLPQASSDVAFRPGGDVIVSAGSPNPDAYAWSNGFGTRFANPANPIAANSGTRSVAFNSVGNVVGYGGVHSSQLQRPEAYVWSNGFSTKFTAPTTGPPLDSSPFGISSSSTTFHPSGDVILQTTEGAFDSNAVYAYPIIGGSSFGSVYADPPTLAFIDSSRAAFHPAGNAVAVHSSGAEACQVLSWTAGGFGTKFADPAAAIGAVVGVAFNAAGDTLLFSPNGGTLQAYVWSSITGFGTKYAAPSTAPSGGISQDAQFNPDGNAIVMANNQTPFLNAYAWSSGFGTKFANPAVLPPSSAVRVNFR